MAARGERGTGPSSGLSNGQTGPMAQSTRAPRGSRSGGEDDPVARPALAAPRRGPASASASGRTCVFAATPCRAANASISRIAGRPPIDARGDRLLPAQERPDAAGSGARRARRRSRGRRSAAGRRGGPSQSWPTKTVERTKSSVPAAERRAFGSRVARKWWAPKPRASASLSGLEEIAVTSQPMARANCRARWPRPPMPDDADPHRGLHPAAQRRVDGHASAQEGGRVLGGERVRDREGEAAVHADRGRRSRRGGPRRWPTFAAQRFSSPATQASQARQAPRCQPTPDPRARLEVPHLGPERRHRADDLVAGDHRVAAPRPSRRRRGGRRCGRCRSG